jgi:cytochrome c oxidase cbb3-type subunit 3
MCRLLFSSLLLAQSLFAQHDSGKALFRSNCAFCHGADATGGRGPSLISAKIAQNTSDAAIKDIVRNGIPGTTMPGFDDIEGDDMNKLVGYIRGLAGPNVKAVALPGDAAHGEQLYTRNGCASCHRVGERGSSFGPDLSRIGGARSFEYIRQSIVEPSADIPPDYEGVTVVTKDGKRVSGTRVNEDTFSVQLRLQDEKFALFDKRELKEVVYEKKSMMPAYQKLAAGDLQDLLAYLNTLRGSTASTADAAKAKGVH